MQVFFTDFREKSALIAIFAMMVEKIT